MNMLHNVIFPETIIIEIWFALGGGGFVCVC